MGVKFVSRSPSPLVPECDFRVTQEVSMSVCNLAAKSLQYLVFLFVLVFFVFLILFLVVVLV